MMSGAPLRTASVPSAGERDRWVIRSPRSRTARACTFCFHCAGGSAGQFRHWDLLAPAHIEFAGVQLPGRERNDGQPAAEELPQLVEMLTRQLIPHLDRPFALFGHSLGALVAFEVARALRRLDAPQPRQLFVAARPAPHLPHAVPAVDELATPQFIEVLRAYGGLSEEALRDAALMRELLPTIRADFKLVRRYSYRHEEPLDYPLYAFGGDNDPACSEAGLRAWEDQTSRTFFHRIFQGGHFFVRRHAHALVLEISKALEA